MMDVIDDIASDFALLNDWEQRYQYLIELGEALPPLPDTARIDANRVHACMSKVWVQAFPDPEQPGHIRFHGDCDTSIIKGVVALLVNVFSGKTRQQILDMEVDVLFDSIHLAENLSPARHVGVYAIVEKMRDQVRALPVSI